MRNWAIGDLTFRDPTEYEKEVDELRSQLSNAGLRTVDHVQGTLRDVPALIVGSGPTYNEIEPKSFDGFVIACNAASIEGYCHFGVMGDAKAAIEMLRDAKRPTVYRTNKDLIGKTIEAIRRSGSPSSYAMFPPRDVAILNTPEGGVAYRFRMTGTVALSFAMALGCSPIVMQGVDYAPYSMDRISRYPVTKWYTPPDVYEKGLVGFRQQVMPEHWRDEIHVTERLCIDYIRAGGLVYVAKRGVMNIPVLPGKLRIACTRTSPAAIEGGL